MAPKIDITSTPASLEEMQASGGPTIEIVGKNPSQSSSLEELLGMEEAKGYSGGPGSREHPMTSKVLSADADSGGSSPDLDALKQELERTRAELAEAKAEPGRLGRNVIGPLKAEIAELREKIERSASRPEPQSQTAAMTPEEAYQRIFPDADPSANPEEARRLGRLAIATLNASEAGAQALHSELLNEIRAIREDVAGVASLSRVGVDQEDVQQLEEDYPELKALPKSQRYSLIAKLLSAADDEPTAPARRAAPAQPAMEPAEFHIEGGSGTFASPADVNRATEQAKIARYKEISRDINRKHGGGAEAATHVFLDMLRREGRT